MDSHVRPVTCQGLVRPTHLYTRSHYVTTVESRGTVFDKCSQITAYADDVVIMGRELQDVEEVFTSLIEQTNKMGIEINEKHHL
jgi:hypothetical protein